MRAEVPAGVLSIVEMHWHAPPWGWLLIGFEAVAALAWLAFNCSPSHLSSLRYQIKPADEADSDGDLPPVVVLSPGRNEANWIPQTLPELCRQDYPNYGVVFVDDQSDDETPTLTDRLVAEHPNLLVVRNQTDPPAGWMGKCWAIQQGYVALKAREIANAESPDAPDPGGMLINPDRAQSDHLATLGQSEWICLTDADINWDPRCLRAAMRHGQQHDADLVAMLPRLRYGSFLEAVVQMQLALALGLMFPFDKAMDPAYEDTITSGAFMLIRRELYDRIGGHEAVKGFVIDDINLGKAIKREGGKIRIGVALDLLSCRMYESFADMWEGLAKHAYAAAYYKPHIGLGMAMAAICFNALAPVYLLASIAWMIIAPNYAAGLALFLAITLLLLQMRPLNGVRKMSGLPWYYAWTLPLGSAIYLAIFIDSVRKYYTAGNTWKGRSYNKAALEADTGR